MNIEINKDSLIGRNGKEAQSYEAMKFFYVVNPERFKDILLINGVMIVDEIDLLDFIEDLKNKDISFNRLKFFNDMKINSTEIAKKFKELNLR